MKHPRFIGFLILLTLFFSFFGLEGESAVLCRKALKANWYESFITNPTHFLHLNRSDIFNATENHVMILKEALQDFRELETLPDSEQKFRFEGRLKEVLAESLSLSDFLNVVNRPEWNYEIQFVLFKAEYYRVFHFLNENIKKEDFESVQITSDEQEILLSHPDVFKDFQFDLNSTAFKRAYFMTEVFLSKNSIGMELTPFLKMFLTGLVMQNWSYKNGWQFKSQEEKIQRYLSSANVKSLQVLYSLAVRLLHRRTDLLDHDLLKDVSYLNRIGGSRTKLIKDAKAINLFTKAWSRILNRYLGVFGKSINMPISPDGSPVNLDLFEDQTVNIMRCLNRYRDVIGENLLDLKAMMDSNREWDEFIEMVNVVHPWITISDQEIFENLNGTATVLRNSIHHNTERMNALIGKTDSELNHLLETHQRSLSETKTLGGASSFLGNMVGPRDRKEEIFVKHLPNEKTLQRKEEKRLRKKSRIDPGALGLARSASEPELTAEVSKPELTYHRILTNSFEKSFTNLPGEVKNVLKEEKVLDSITLNPYLSGELKKNNFPRYVRVYKFGFNRVKYRLGYEIHGQQVVFFYVGKREDFYEIIQRRYHSGTSVKRTFEEAEDQQEDRVWVSKKED